MPSILTRPQSRPLRQTLLFWLLVLGIMIVGVLWLEGYVRDQFVSALQISGQVDRGRRGWTDDQVESLLNDTLLVFGSLAILLAPMALALAIGETRPGGAGWKLLTFIRRDLRSGHRVCGLASSVGERDGYANELPSTRHVSRAINEARRIAAKLPDLLRKEGRSEPG